MDPTHVQKVRRRRRLIERIGVAICLLTYLKVLINQIVIGPPGGWSKSILVNIATTIINSIFQTLNFAPQGMFLALILTCIWYGVGRIKSKE